MTSCQERIAHLTEVLANLQESRTAHIKLFPPVHTLPVEISLKVFEFAVKKPYPFSSIQDGPWRLGHVCRLWRQITSAPSSLWSFPSCRLSSTGICSIPMLRTVFERSSPVSFDVELSGEFFDIIKSHSLRWYDITISGTMKSFPQLRAVGDLPLLVTVSLKVHSAVGIESYSFAQTLDMFRHAPRLRSLKLEGLFPLSDSLQSSFPWHQLTHLETERTSTFLDDCQLLAHCPNLHAYSTFSVREPGPSESLLHSNLKSLNLVHIGLLCYLRCMSLTELRLVPHWLGDEEDADVAGYISALRSFVAQSPVLACVRMSLLCGTTSISSFVSPFSSASINTFKLQVEGAPGTLYI
ncbi:hypothetical protein CPB85DRAFT_883301 [Mucidula mucida]|nr:hypothetical protein CPB85DRAFT_883301 [Mucidula mucida]